MKLYFLAIGIFSLLLGGCQTSGLYDDIPNILPRNTYKWYQQYLKEDEYKAFALSRYISKPRKYGWISWCSGRISVKEAITCAVERCNRDKKKSPRSYQFPFDCRPFSIGNLVVSGKSEQEIAALAKKYERDFEKSLTEQNTAPQAKTLSVQEAQEITVTFNTPIYVPPPRSVRDVIVLLHERLDTDQFKGADELAKAREIPAEYYDDIWLAGFLLERSKALLNIGDINANYLDLVRAEHLSIPENWTHRLDWITRADILMYLAFAEFRVGKFIDAGKHIEAYYDIVNSNNEEYLIVARPAFSIQYALIGDLETADAYLSESELYLKRFGLSIDADKVFFYENGRLKATGFAKDGQHSKRWPARWYTLLAKAVLLDARGKYAEAEPYFRAVLSRAREKGRTFIYERLITNLIHQGRSNEAEIEARNALSNVLDMFGASSRQTALMVSALAQAVGAQARYEEAEDLLRIAINIFEKVQTPKSAWLFLDARRSLARTLLLLGKQDEAVSEFDDLEKLTAGTPLALRDARDIDRPVALMRVGRRDEAVQASLKAYTSYSASLGQDHSQTIMARGIYAASLAESSRFEDALKEFSQVVPLLIGTRMQSVDYYGDEIIDDVRRKFIVESYLDLLVKTNQPGNQYQNWVDPATEGFGLLEVIRTSSVQRALSASSARNLAMTEELAELIRQEQDTVHYLKALKGMLETLLLAPRNQQIPNAVSALRRQIDHLSEARQILNKEVHLKFPEYAELENPKLASIDEVRNALRTEECLILYYVGSKRTYVWAITKFGTVSFTTVDLNGEALAEMVKSIRATLEPDVATIGDIPSFDIKNTHTLYKKILEPVEASWKGARSLLVITDGPLEQLPFSLLPTKSVELFADNELLFSNYRDIPWLARTHAVTVLPSVASLIALRRTIVAEKDRFPFAGFGDPYFTSLQAAAAEAQDTSNNQVAEAGENTEGETRSASLYLRSTPQTRKVDSASLALLPRLPDTRDEIIALANSMGADMNRDVFLGRAASEHQVKTMDLSGYKVLSFATHGLVAGDLDGLTQPALAFSSPTVTVEDDGNDDGLLTMGEILGLKLNADWVVLSACNTAAANGEGAEALSGLGRAFFYAGTRAVLASSWPVHSAATTELMTMLFDKQAGNDNLGRAEALQQTRVQLIDQGTFKNAQGKELFSYAHPIFWAPFIIIGDGGGALSGS